MTELIKKIVDEIVAKDFISNYTYAIYDNFEEEMPQADIVISTRPNLKKIKYGSTSGNIKVYIKDTEKPLSCTVYCSEKKFGKIYVFVNDLSHDLVTAASGNNALERCYDHIVKYLENSIKSMLGINTPKENIDKEKTEN